MTVQLLFTLQSKIKIGENSKKSKASNLVKSRFWGIFVSIEYVKNKCCIGIKLVHFLFIFDS